MAEAPYIDAQVQKWLAEKAQRGAMGGATGPAMGGAAAAPAPTAPSWLQRAWAATKGVGARGAATLGRWGARVGGPLAALAGMGAGMASNAAEEINKGYTPGTEAGGFFTDRRARMPGAIESLVRIASGADITGIGGYMGRQIAGQDELVGTSPMVGPATRQYIDRGKPGFGAVQTAGNIPSGSSADTEDANLGAAVFPGGVPKFEPMASPHNLIVPPAGTGFMKNNRTGATTYFDARPRGPGAVADPNAADPRYMAPLNTTDAMGGFTNAVLRMKQTQGNVATNLARQKLLVDAMTKGATAEKEHAIAGQTDMQMRMALEHLKSGGGLVEAGAIAHGLRSVPPGEFVMAPNYMGDYAKGAPVYSHRTGAYEMKTPVQKVTVADFEAAKKQYPNKTPAQIIEGYRSQGHDVSALKP